MSITPTAGSAAPKSSGRCVITAPNAWFGSAGVGPGVRCGPGAPGGGGGGGAGDEPALLVPGLVPGLPGGVPQHESSPGIVGVGCGEERIADSGLFASVTYRPPPTGVVRSGSMGCGSVVITALCGGCGFWPGAASKPRAAPRLMHRVRANAMRLPPTAPDRERPGSNGAVDCTNGVERRGAPLSSRAAFGLLPGHSPPVSRGAPPFREKSSMLRVPVCVASTGSPWSVFAACQHDDRGARATAAFALDARCALRPRVGRRSRQLAGPWSPVPLHPRADRAGLMPGPARGQP